MRGRRRIGRLNLDGDGQADLAATAASIAPPSSTQSNRILAGASERVDRRLHKFGIAPHRGDIMAAHAR